MRHDPPRELWIVYCADWVVRRPVWGLDAAGAALLAQEMDQGEPSNGHPLPPCDCGGPHRPMRYALDLREQGL